MRGVFEVKLGVEPDPQGNPRIDTETGKKIVQALLGKLK